MSNIEDWLGIANGKRLKITEKRAAREGQDVLRGGCPCGFWSLPNCRYVHSVGLCRSATGPHTPHRAERPEATEPTGGQE